MEQIILYHGSPNQKVSPQYGLGDEKFEKRGRRLDAAMRA